VSSTSPHISVTELAESSSVPSFRIATAGRPTGVRFDGIPGGHEFTSLIVAILNAGGLGKLPDPGIQEQIRSLPPGLTLRTFVSLSCENCPDVVQALNQLSLIHPDLSHTMVDGGLVQSEVERLQIKGVPAVFLGDKMIHSGRGDFSELLSKLTAEVGGLKKVARDLGHFDVCVIGGGPAGVSAAIYSARKGLKTALIAGKIGGQVSETKGIENLISVLYTEGPELAAAMQKHLTSYPVSLLEMRQVETIGDYTDRKRAITLNTGEHLSAESIIVATGAKWRELQIPGEKEYIGRGVAFCPHCDGPFYKDKRVAVIGGGNSGVEAAIDLAGIASDVVLLEYMPTLRADQVLVDKLRSLKNARIITSAKTSSIAGDGGKVTGIAYVDRDSNSEERLALDGVFVQIGLLPNSGFLKGVLDMTQHGEIKTDEKGRTSAKGIYAAGDVTTVPYKQIVIAMGEGAKVALAAFEDRMKS
jgi:alkyl hydroperoxide reductase subunit F